MVIKVKRADGETEIYMSDRYRISRFKDFHPIILGVSVYDNGRKIESVSRPFPFFYKHIIFKTKKVQKMLREIIEAEKKEETEKEAENSADRVE